MYLLHNDEFYQINSSDQLEFIANIPVSGSGENILTGGMGSNYPFFYAHVGGQIYQSMNGGNSWIDRGERPQWYFNLQNSFNSSKSIGITSSGAAWKFLKVLLEVVPGIS